MKAPNMMAWAMISAFSLLTAVACSKGNSSTGSAGACLPNQVFDGVNCVYATTPYGTGAGSQIGFYAQSSNVVQPLNGGSQMNLGTGFNTLLKDAMGVCDRNYSNGGYAACAQWYSGYHDMVVLFDGSTATTAKLIIRSSPYINPYSNYYYSLPNFEQFILGLFGLATGNIQGIYNPLVLTTTVWPVNNSKGFELRTNGPAASKAWSKLIQFQALNNKIEDPTIGFTMYIDGGNKQMLNAVSGTMIRCQTQGCGLQGL